MFTREFIIECILFTLEKNKDLLTIEELFNKVKRKIHPVPEDDILKFNFIVSLNYMISSGVIFTDNKFIVLKKNNEPNIFEFDELNIKQLINDVKNNLLKKIIIDVKNNKNIYEKYGLELILNQFINI